MIIGLIRGMFRVDLIIGTRWRVEKHGGRSILGVSL